MEFGSGVVGAEAPVNGDARGVAPSSVGGDGTFQGVGIGYKGRRENVPRGRPDRRFLVS